jgi:predicted phosphodiesterase
MKDEPFRILVLSDVHFGSWSHYTCDFSSFSTNPQNWATQLLDELGVCLKPPSPIASPPYDAVVLNGDVTSLCEEDGFSATKSLINGLIKRQYSRSKRDFLLLPGNHDVVRDPSGRPLAAQKREAKFREKYHEFLGVQHASEQHLGVLQIYKRQKVALIGLDSCRIEGSDNPGIGYIGFDQLESLIATLEETEEKLGPFRRLAFVHHHIETPENAVPDWMLTPKEDRRFSFTADTKSIQEGLVVFHVDFLFHGHFHTPELSAVVNRLRSVGRIVSAGSVAGALSRCADQTRQFMLLELFDKKLVIHDFRKRGLGNWIASQEIFDLPARRSIELSDAVRSFRRDRTFVAISELTRYGKWVTAAEFFAGDADVILSVKRKLQGFDAWRKDAAAFEAAWNDLADYLRRNGTRALAKYKNTLTDPRNGLTLEQYIFNILKRLKR